MSIEHLCKNVVEVSWEVKVTKATLINRWKVAGTFVGPNGILSNSYTIQKLPSLPVFRSNFDLEVATLQVQWAKPLFTTQSLQCFLYLRNQLWVLSGVVVFFLLHKKWLPVMHKNQVTTAAVISKSQTASVQVGLLCWVELIFYFLGTTNLLQYTCFLLLSVTLSCDALLLGHGPLISCLKWRKKKIGIFQRLCTICTRWMQ